MSGPVTPARSLAQRQSALVLANEVRSARARFKEHLFGLARRDSLEAAVGALVDPPAEVQTMYVHDLVLACRQIGEAKAHRVLLVAQVSPRKRVGGITDRQRDALVDAIRRLHSPGDPLHTPYHDLAAAA